MIWRVNTNIENKATDYFIPQCMSSSPLKYVFRIILGMVFQERLMLIQAFMKSLQARAVERGPLTRYPVSVSRDEFKVSLLSPALENTRPLFLENDS